jgi:hypothetical protein
MNLEHLKAALDNDEERCMEIPVEQARICLLDPLHGIIEGNAAALKNGASGVLGMKEILSRHALDVSTWYVGNPELYPESWEGAWMEYARELDRVTVGDVIAGPDNIDFVNAATGHLLINRMFYNAVANDGKLITPVLVKQVVDEGEVVKEYTTEVVNEQICSPTALADLQECMEAVVSDNLGTARSIRNMPIKVAGKTGTAQIAQTKENRGVDDKGNPNAYIAKDGSRDYFSSFVGYFPADNPKYTCIVALKVNVPKGNKDKRYTGASLTLDAFREIAEYIYSHDPEWKIYAEENVAAEPTAKSTKGIYDHREGTVPKVIGMGLRDAPFELESLGLKVNISGSGVVVEQSLESYSPFTPGDEITLRLENRK